MKINNQNKGKIAVAIGIVLAWGCIISWAFYKEMDTDLIVLFIVMAISAGVVPILNMFKDKNEKQCSLNNGKHVLKNFKWF